MVAIRFLQASFNAPTSRMKPEPASPSAAWIDGVLGKTKKTSTSRTTPVRASFCGARAQLADPSKREMGHPRWKNSDLMVVCRSVPNGLRRYAGPPRRAVSVRPQRPSFENPRFCHRRPPSSLQWRDPGRLNPCLNPSLTTTIIKLFRRPSRSAIALFKNSPAGLGERAQHRGPDPRIQRAWRPGGIYHGQSLERMKMHMANSTPFDRPPPCAPGGPADGRFYGLPWPAWGTTRDEPPRHGNLVR